MCRYATRIYSACGCRIRTIEKRCSQDDGNGNCPSKTVYTEHLNGYCGGDRCKNAGDSLRYNGYHVCPREARGGRTEIFGNAFDDMQYDADSFNSHIPPNCTIDFEYW